MRFITDQTMPKASVEEIRALGNLVRIFSADDDAEPDALLDAARRQDRIVLTFETALYDRLFEADAPRPPGVVCFDLECETPRDPAHVLSAVLSEDDLEIDGFFTLLESDRMRQRRL